MCSRFALPRTRRSASRARRPWPASRAGSSIILARLVDVDRPRALPRAFHALDRRAPTVRPLFLLRVTSPPTRRLRGALTSSSRRTSSRPRSPPPESFAEARSEGRVRLPAASPRRLSSAPQRRLPESRVALEARAGGLEQCASRLDIGSNGRSHYAQCSRQRA
jgi:hypothetical protein